MYLIYHLLLSPNIIGYSTTINDIYLLLFIFYCLTNTRGLLYMILLYYLPIKRCPDCYNSDFVYDYEKNELYCPNCGLILCDNELTTIKQRETIEQYEQKQIREEKETKAILTENLEAFERYLNRNVFL